MRRRFPGLQIAVDQIVYAAGVNNDIGGKLRRAVYNRDIGAICARKTGSVERKDATQPVTVRVISSANLWTTIRPLRDWFLISEAYEISAEPAEIT